MIIKHRANPKMPEFARVKDPETAKGLIDIMRFIDDSFKNIYDDLVRILPEVVATLPTASAEYYQRFLLKNNGGGDDTLHICIWDDSASDYKWQQVTLS